jgi:hypothetical protein
LRSKVKTLKALLKGDTYGKWDFEYWNCSKISKIRKSGNWK